jgi:murein DD-endopeptidase MepM/ murein hydrolase activator NlpD
MSNRYLPPISEEFSAANKAWKKFLWMVEQLVAGTHKGDLRHALDFMEPEGTPVRSVEKGVVAWIRQDSQEGGPFRRYWYSGNRVVIKHEGEVYSAYEHLRYGGVFVKKGDTVSRGQIIGEVGSTGYGLFPHLHFELFQKPDAEESEGVTIPVEFVDK